MLVDNGVMKDAVPPSLIVVPDGLIVEEDDAWVPNPALGFACSKLRRSSKKWVEVPALAPIEWYATLLGLGQGASRLLATALTDAIPADARQSWLVSPFAGRLGRDKVHIMPDEVFAWDIADSEWLMKSIQPLLDGEGLTLLARDSCILAVSPAVWDARPASFAQVAGHVLPDRHPVGSDGGRLMRLCVEMQMFLAAHPSPRRRTSGLPDIMGVWLWAASDLPADPVKRPWVKSNDRLVRACADEADGLLSAAIMQAAQVEAEFEQEKLPRYWLLAGDGKAVLIDRLTFPRFFRNPWSPRYSIVFEELCRKLRTITDPETRVA